MLDRRKIERNVLTIINMNMAVKAGDKLLIVTDIPTSQEWRIEKIEKLLDFSRRSILAKMVSEIALKSFPSCEVEFYVYPSVGMHGVYPGNKVEEKMKSADVVIAITTHSLTHTDARERACRAGTRVASMPTFLIEMLYPGGPIAVNYKEMASKSRKIAGILTKAKRAHITSKEGTDLTFDLGNRKALIDTGIFAQKGAWGNLPSGEAYISPLEGTAKGTVVVEKGWFPDLKQEMRFTLAAGEVENIVGGGEVGRRFKRLLALEKNEEPYQSRRNLAEFGVGTNSNARRHDNFLEAEKIEGTIHIAIGDNSHMGGAVTSDIHQDFIIPCPNVILDEKLVLKDGRMI